MKCFDVVRLVLDATYDEVLGEEHARDKAISGALTDMAKKYATVKAGGGPTFADPVIRFAYVFQHVAAHAHWLYDLLSNCEPIMKVFESGKARIACVGGGPGSDLVGVLKVLDEKKIECKLFCELLDGCAEWKLTWGDLSYQLNVTAVHTDYVIHDVADKKTWSSPSHIGKADIITISFFISEIFHLKNTSDYLTKLFSSAKSSAIVVMNDFRDIDIYGLCDKVAAENSLKIIEKGDGQKKIYDSGEDMQKLQKYTKKFGRGSKLTGYNAWRIYQKG